MQSPAAAVKLPGTEEGPGNQGILDSFNKAVPITSDRVHRKLYLAPRLHFSEPWMVTLRQASLEPHYLVNSGLAAPVRGDVMHYSAVEASRRDRANQGLHGVSLRALARKLTLANH